MKCIPLEDTAPVARDESFWQGFPGMCMTSSGRLVVGIKQAYGHGAARWAKIIAQTSDDRGATWSEPQILAAGDFDKGENCIATGGAYLTLLRSGRLLLHYFTEEWPERKPTTPVLHISDDNGDSWSDPIRITKDLEFRPDGAILECRDGSLLVYTGLKRVLRSVDQGESWEPYGEKVVPDDCPLMLGEVCLSELPDGRIMILMRENHYANFPMFACYSEDGGATWSKPAPTPFIGHWPYTCEVGDGRHVLAYRNVGGRANSFVWCGDLSSIPGYEVSSCRYGNTDPSSAIADEGLVIDNDGTKHQFTQFFLFPADNLDASISMEAEVRCLSNAGQGCAVGLRGAGWLRIFPDHFDLEHIPEDSVFKVDGSQWHTYRMELERRSLRILVDGQQVFVNPPIDNASITHAPCNAFGNKFHYRELPRCEHYPMRVRLPRYVKPENSGKSIWRFVKLDIAGNRWLPDYHYEWRFNRNGLPDQWQEENLLELEYCQDAGDWGKPIVAVFEDGECFAIDYFGNGMPVGHHSLAFLQPDRGQNCYVNGYRFQLKDIPGGSRQPCVNRHG